MSSSTLAVLDMGTSSITALIGSKNTQGLNIIGYGESPSIGFKKDVVFDIDACAKSIRTALNQAEKEAGIEVQHVYVGFSGCDIVSTNVISGIDIPKSKKEISARNLQLLFETCRAKARNDGLKLVHLIPREYAVDGNWGIDDPIGRVGQHLKIEAHLIQGRAAALQNLYQALEHAGVKVKGIFFTPLVLAHRLLQPVEKEVGTMLVDIGGNTTGLCWYRRGGPWLTISLPVGSEHVTGDLAIGLRLSLSAASKLKVKYGLKKLPAGAEEVELEGQARKVPGRLISEIIEARVLELVDLIKMSIKEYGQGTRPLGLVITGGGAQLSGLPELLAEAIDLPVRVADFKNEDAGIPPNGGSAAAVMEYAVDTMVKDCEHKNKLLTKLKSGFRSVIHRFRG
ncbi:cell division protein FtsA [Desulfohalotomaculum tongense]|uniref:cell division protein FtsA n=1 Tax=Desulforadius tongensis TaxID=1216062 RepID=UPI001959A6B3|nr:cell division protein FtsA [Desulforadius tongensis]